MEWFSAGAFIMVKSILKKFVKKCVFILLLTSSLIANAGLTIGVHNNSWQEPLPISYVDTNTSQVVNEDRLGTFSTISLGVGYEDLFTKRWRYGFDFQAHYGTVDLHKLESFGSPRNYTQTFSFGGKINYRVSKTFSFGPLLSVHYNTIKNIGNGVGFNALLNMDFDIFDETRLVQTLGTTQGSKTLTYSIGLNRIF